MYTFAFRIKLKQSSINGTTVVNPMFPDKETPDRLSSMRIISDYMTACNEGISIEATNLGGNDIRDLRLWRSLC